MPQSHDMVLALPVKGEAFLLRRAGRAVLVDGGWEKDNIANVLARYVRDVTHLDVVLCTHGDADHAGGLPNLLNRWAGRVSQVWLPGRWVEVVPHLARDPVGFLRTLIRELDSESQHPSNFLQRTIREDDDEISAVGIQEVPAAQQRVESFPDLDRFEKEDLGSDSLDDPNEPEWFTSLRHVADQLAGDATASRAFAAARSKVLRRRRRWKGKARARIALYWLGLIDTAKAIRGIAVAAVRHNIRTRWFDFEAFARRRRATGGERGLFVPINSIEQAPPPTERQLYMHLTIINRESLVFLAPPARGRLGVLFCADSPLGDGLAYAQSFLPPRPDDRFWPIVATAPHHGSESNCIAYTHLRRWADVAVLLRAGGSDRQPGPTFIGQSHCLRLCAKCPRAGHGPLLTGVVACGWYRTWPSVAMGRRCDCT